MNPDSVPASFFIEGNAKMRSATATSFRGVRHRRKQD